MSKMVMNKELQKYQGRIYFLHDNGRLEKVDNVFSTADYNHYEFECHHVIKYTDYEKNRVWYEKEGLEMCLCLMRRTTHHHLENPVCALPDDMFFKKYSIHRHDLLFNRKTYNAVGSKFPQILKEKTQSFELEYDGCFDELESGVSCGI